MIVGNIFSALWTHCMLDVGMLELDLRTVALRLQTCLTKLQWIELDDASAVMPVRRTRPGMDYEEAA